VSSAGVILAVAVAAVIFLGFFAARWGNANLGDLEQWALGGRRFGTIVSWFLLGGDLYTAYTFIAVPALVYGVGALGFFAVPYATLAYPVALVVLPRFWTVARARGYVTAADFIRDRYDDRGLEIAIALTGETFPNVRPSEGGGRVVSVSIPIEHVRDVVGVLTLEATHFKIGRAAEILGISRKTLLEKRKKYELK